MASRLLKMAQSALKSAFTPTRSTPVWRISPFQSSILTFNSSTLPYTNIPLIRSTYPGCPEFHDKFFISRGICVDDPTLVVTTVLSTTHIVGQSIGGSGHCTTYIGSATAITSDGQLKLKPVAVSFARDIAMLKVVENEQTLREKLLMAVTFDAEEWKRWVVRAVGQKTIPAKAPWPLKDELGWIEFNRGPVPPSSFLYDCEEKVSGSKSMLSGSPWFNLHGELVGLASWVLRDDKASFSVGYMAPVVL